MNYSADDRRHDDPASRAAEAPISVANHFMEQSESSECIQTPPAALQLLFGDWLNGGFTVRWHDALSYLH